MELKKAVTVTALFLLLQLITCCDAATPQSQCKGGTCYISPDNFSYIGNVIHSNRDIILNGGEFSLDENSGSVLIENVYNLTISGGERGSHIQCSPNSTFGFYLRNTANVTLTGLTITSCGFIHYWLCNVQFGAHCLISLVIEASRNVTLLGVHIEHSPELALFIISDENVGNPEKPFFYTEDANPNIIVSGCNISYGGNGSVLIYGKESLLLQNTVIAHSDYGIISQHSSDIMMKSVQVISCLITQIEGGYIMVRDKLIFNRSLFIIFSSTLHISGGRVLFHYGYNGRGLSIGKKYAFQKYYLLITDDSTVEFTGFTPFFRTYALYVDSASIKLNNSTLVFLENTVPMFYLAEGLIDIDIANKSSLIIANNSIVVDTNGAYLWPYSLRLDQDSEIVVINNTGLSVNFLSNNAYLSGKVRISNNSNSKHLYSPKFEAQTYFTVLSIADSAVLFNGSLEVVGNRENGGIIVDNSDLYFYGTATFSDNNGINGGAIALINSVMHISSNATVDFTRNSAREYGGAIYITRPRETPLCGRLDGLLCSIRSLHNCDLFGFSITFNQNKASIAGNAIYGGRTSACFALPSCRQCSIPDISELHLYNGVNDSSDLSKFTSDPTRVCFCENGIPDCYKVLETISVHPGEDFTLSLAIVGYGLGTVPGSVIARGSGDSQSEQNLFGSELEDLQEIRGTKCQDVQYSIVSERDREQIKLAVETLSLLMSLDEVQEIKNSRAILISLYDLRYYYSSLDEFLHIPVFVEINLLPCPVGFQLVREKCVCQQILRDNNIHSCFFSNDTAFILRPNPYWIGLPNDNDSNSSILIHPHCPLDYCISKDINITAESPDTQCQYQRSGVLCGSCREGLSMILGSSECKTCSNLYLTSILIFILAGAMLVTLVTLLNMTVSVGTLNGLILFANILQADPITFLPPTTNHTFGLVPFLRAFVAWLNLDLGIPMCFFDGLTTYYKTWLQFVFPLYILALVGAIIIVTKYSACTTRLFGTNAVSVLATLVLLSYTKILRILITAFSFTIITGSQDYHSVVWLADGNVKYFEPKHAILFLVALLVMLLLGVPYTLTLTAAPWIQSSRFKWASSLYNKFKPLFDAYMGPYKESHRYWTGMMLLARAILIVLFSSFANTNTVAGPQLNLLLLTISTCALLVLTTFLKPYRNKLLSGLEIFHLTILFFFSSSNLYVSSIGTGIETRAAIYIVLVGICFLVFLGICAGHVWYGVRKAGSGRRPEPTREREEEEEELYPSMWREGVRIQPEEEEDEEREDVISTAGATNTSSYQRSESLVELIANAD